MKESADTIPSRHSTIRDPADLLATIRPVPRNAEVIRQWTILRAIEHARSSGLTIDELSAQCGVTTRTIRRDLQALEEAGFPLYDDRSQPDGRARAYSWRRP